MVSEMHCNFLINVDNATGYDLELLGETVRARVLETSGVRAPTGRSSGSAALATGSNGDPVPRSKGLIWPPGY